VGRLLEFARPGRDHRLAARLARLPDGLDAELALVERAVNAQLDGEGFRGELRLTRKLARALREDVVESLFESATLLALPLLVVLVREEDDVLGRDVGRPARRREHLALHDRLDLARDPHQKVLPDAARPRLLVHLRERVVGNFTVNPASNRVEYAHFRLSPHRVETCDYRAFRSVLLTQ